MEIPEGVNTVKSDKCCKLVKSLYGLKQAPRCWNERYNDYIIALGFERSRLDYEKRFEKFIKKFKTKTQQTIIYLIFLVSLVALASSCLRGSRRCTNVGCE